MADLSVLSGEINRMTQIYPEALLRTLSAAVQLSFSRNREQPAVSGCQPAIPLRDHVVYYLFPDPVGPFLRVRRPQWRTTILWENTCAEAGCRTT
jgi:hypothetical protein